MFSGSSMCCLLWKFDVCMYVCMYVERISKRPEIPNGNKLPSWPQLNRTVHNIELFNPCIPKHSEHFTLQHLQPRPNTDHTARRSLH